MITANEAREMANNIRTLEKEKIIPEVLEWCATCEKGIIVCAKGGYLKSTFKLPLQYVGMFFDKEDICSVIKKFFNSLGYEVNFGDTAVVITWA